jgi:D-arabinose 1-dehydrogenase-like Zn-dependent alcohol dehydrogenase
LRVTHCGVCHSDLHLQDGYFDLGGGQKLDVRSSRQLPFTFGHEIAGMVEAIGSEAQGVDKTKRYAAFPWIGCGKCGLCARGDEHICNAPRALGITVDGGYATHVLVPHPRYLIDADSVAPEFAGALMCSGLTGYSAIKKAIPYLRVGPLMIVGLGGVGMMGLQFARAMFPNNKIIGCDIDPKKLDAAMSAGAHAVYNSKEADALKKLKLDTGGGVAAAVDFVGSTPSLNFANGAIRRGGEIVVVGLFGGKFAAPIPSFPGRPFSIVGSYTGPLGETREMMDLVKAGKIKAIPIETRPLDQADRTLNQLREGTIVGRVVLKP